MLSRSSTDEIGISSGSHSHAASLSTRLRSRRTDGPASSDATSRLTQRDRAKTNVSASEIGNEALSNTLVLMYPGYMQRSNITDARHSRPLSCDCSVTCQWLKGGFVLCVKWTSPPPSVPGTCACSREVDLLPAAAENPAMHGRHWLLRWRWRGCFRSDKCNPCVYTKTHRPCFSIITLATAHPPRTMLHNTENVGFRA